jgi:transposase InsO family protein
VRQENTYLAIKELHDKKKYEIYLLCELAGIPRSAYYKWMNRKESQREAGNRMLANRIEKIHNSIPQLGYRRMRDVLMREYGIHTSDSHVLRIMRILGIQSAVKFGRQGCTKSDSNPQHTAENILNRNFRADKPNEKWLTDVTEFKYITGNEIHKIYLSAILDLCDRRIVSYVIGSHNNNMLVFSTFDEAVAANPDAHPLFHSDRGFQYTSGIFHRKLSDAGMTQSMSRVARCLDNGPMEGFWGILKREMYYGRKYHDREILEKAIEDYIDYYNNRRYQRKLMTLTPMEAHDVLLAA